MKKTRKTNETGRSMVEMLGVLAIVGVLSVGGVYGYGVAMKKHKANEALHKASLMATTVSAYAMSNDGNLPQNRSEFANLGYETEISDNGTQFNLTVKGIGFDVCTQMQNVKGGMVRDVTCNETTGDATITYYKNLATDPAEGEKSPTGGSSFNPDGATEDDGSDCSADTKLGTECQVCIKGYYQDSDAKCDSGQICVDGACTTPADSDYTGCTRNSDCKGTINGIDCDAKTCYCNYFDYDNEDMRSGSCTGGPNKGSGVCMEATYKDTTVDNDGIAGKLSNDYMDWFSAKNFCQAVGVSMISLKGSGIDKSNLGSFFDENGYCEGSDCVGVDWTKYMGKLSATYWWTKDLEDSCGAFYVDTGRSYIDEYLRNDYYYALCE